MPTAEVISIDRNTGEQLEFTLVAMPRERPRIREGWFMIFQEGLKKLAADGSLTLTQFRVLTFLMSELNFENFINVPQTKIVEGTGLAAPHVSKAIRDLREKGILIAGPKVGRVSTMRLSPTFGWKGRVRSLQEERKKRLMLVGKDQKNREQLEQVGQRRIDE